MRTRCLTWGGLRGGQRTLSLPLTLKTLSIRNSIRQPKTNLPTRVFSSANDKEERTPSEEDVLEFLLDGNEDVPDFDDLVLDDEFYKAVGEDRETIEKYPPWAPEASDPKGTYQSFEDYLESRKDVPDYIKQDLRDAQYFGPPCLVLAGFRLEELPVIREIVDEVAGNHVKVIPVTGSDVLHMKVEDVLNIPEPEWSKPRPPSWTRGGTWGSQRTIVFGGLQMPLQAAIVEVIEESGLPPVCVTIASTKTRDMKLGEILADAIRIQRDRKNPEKQIWDIKDKVVDDASDLDRFYSKKILERVKAVQEGLASGNATLKEDPVKDGVLNVKMDGLKEDIFDAEEISAPLNSDHQPSESRSQETAPPSLAKEHNFKIDQPQAVDNRLETGSGKKLCTEGRDEETVQKGVDSIESVSVDSQEAFDEVLDDFFAVDDLVCEGLGMEKPKRAEIKPPRRIEERISDDTEDSAKRKKIEGMDEDEREEATGNVYPITTELEYMGDGFSKNTVFSGLVPDADAFLKNNFDYDTKKGGLDPKPEDLETTEVTTLAEQEALFEDSDTEITESAREEETVEDVIQAAIKKGIDPQQLKAMIDSFSSSNLDLPQTNFRKRFTVKKHGQRLS